MVHGYDIKSIKNHIAELMGRGIGEYRAVRTAVLRARDAFKATYPERTIMPEHLMPGSIGTTFMGREDNG